MLSRLPMEPMLTDVQHVFSVDSDLVATSVLTVMNTHNIDSRIVSRNSFVATGNHNQDLLVKDASGEKHMLATPDGTSAPWDFYVISVRDGDIAWMRSVGPSGLNSDGSYELLARSDGSVLLFVLVSGRLRNGNAKEDNVIIESTFWDSVSTLAVLYDEHGNLVWSDVISKGWLMVEGCVELTENQVVLYGSFGKIKYKNLGGQEITSHSPGSSAFVAMLRLDEQ